MDEQEQRPVEIHLDLAHAMIAWVDARRALDDEMLRTMELRQAGDDPEVRIDQLVSLERDAHEAFVSYIDLLRGQHRRAGFFRRR